MDRPIAVTWLAWVYPDSRRYSGGFHRTVAQALSRRGVAVDMVVPEAEFPLEPVRSYLRRRWQSCEASDSFTPDGRVRVARPSYFGYPGHTHIGIPDVFMARRVGQVAPRTDLVHAQGVYPGGMAGIRVAEKWGVPLVVTLHGGDVNWYPSQSALYRRRFREVINRADRVVAVSDELAAKTAEFAGRRPTYLPLGIDLSAFRNASDAPPRVGLGLPGSGPIALYVGNLLRNKGVGLLLEASDRFAAAGITLAVAGDGALRQQVAEAKNVTYLGPLSRSQVAQTMQASDVLVLPSRAEGLPTVVCEAGIAGLPVVATPVGGVRSLLGGERGFLIKDWTAKAVFDAVAMTLADTSEMSRRSARLRTEVEQQYDVEVNAGKLESLYRACL